MDALKDPFQVLAIEHENTEFEALSAKPAGLVRDHHLPGSVVVTATFHGFDHDEGPVVTGLDGLAGEMVRARTTVPLLRENIGATVVLLLERGDARRPIVIGILQDPSAAKTESGGPASLVSEATGAVSVQADGERLVVTAEREIVLQCGEASLTLTRAGKVLIKGKYVLSRSSGYNRIKGAVVDIN